MSYWFITPRGIDRVKSSNHSEPRLCTRYVLTKNTPLRHQIPHWGKGKGGIQKNDGAEKHLLINSKPKSS